MVKHLTHWFSIANVLQLIRRTIRVRHKSPYQIPIQRTCKTAQIILDIERNGVNLNMCIVCILIPTSL
ncbi:hypothetical protein ACOMHN_033461 [Nucella lapillus]